MPKIIVREYDNTKAGLVDYQNFSVVVPGKVKSGNRDVTLEDGTHIPYGFNDEGKSVFDTNGVYECNSQESFIKYIGIINEKTVEQEAEFATVDGAFGLVSETNWNIFGPRGMNELYTFEEIPVYQYDADECSYMHDSNGLKIEVTEVTEDHKDIKDMKNKRLKAIIDGKLYKFTIADKYEATAEYARIITGNEGANETYADPVFLGNQYAYELLGLGYTVLYMKLEDESEMEDVKFFEALKDRSVYDFRYITTGGYEHFAAYESIKEIASFRNSGDSLDQVESYTGRGDCIALMDIIEKGADNIDIISLNKQSDMIKAIIKQVNNNLDFADKYCAIFAPHVFYDKYDKYFEDIKSTPIPSSFNYLACAAKAFKNYDEWFSVAGYTRGVSPYTITGTSIVLGEIGVNALEPRRRDVDSYGELNGLKHSVNVTTYIRGEYYIWGNRTAHLLPSKSNRENNDLIASHFLNVRQLCTTIKKDCYMVCKSLTFNPNSDLLWVDFCNGVRPTLEKMLGNQGIKGYKIVRVKSDRKALIKAKIKIVPIEAVEDFEISLYLEDSLAGVTVGVDELD